MYGLLETEILVPELWENPDGPNSRFQAVSAPPGDHVRSTELVVIFDEAIVLIIGHVMHDLSSIKSIAKSPVKLLPLV